MNFNEALQKAAAYCSLSEKCEYEVKEKLRTWDVSNTDVAKVIDQLRHDDFINDARYCTYYTRDKFRFNRWGKIKIGMMLRSKQLPEEEITNARATLNELEVEHRDLNLIIDHLAATPLPEQDQLLIHRLKKRKLMLKDKIYQLERMLVPDVPA